MREHWNFGIDMDSDFLIPKDVESISSGWVFSVDKPIGWTSFDVVAKLRNTIKNRYGVRIKVGHAGTLDPLATGVLVICAGKATKKIESFVEAHKKYHAQITLGAKSKTYDSESEIIPTNITPPQFSTKIEKEIKSNFTGLISQKPPIYSAIRVNGERAYKHARKGNEIDMPLRQVNIHELIFLKTEGEKWEIEITCSKGTYIRSLANDIGELLGCGGYLSSLTRTEVGSHTLKNSMALSDCLKTLETI